MALCAGSAAAQPSIALSATSDYRYRGYSLSDGRPAGIVTVSYDQASGLFVSGSAIAATTRSDRLRIAGYQAYLGYAHRFGADASWDAGVSRTDVEEYYQPRYRVRYDELYAGVTTPKLSAHLYYSPNYLGEKTATLYATATRTWVPKPDWKVFVEGGVLIPVRRTAISEIRRAQYDVAAGVARRIGDIELQATVSRFGPDDDLVAGHPQGHTGAALALTAYF